jgi:DNA-binding NarL/FixJ family response regulator
MSESTPAVPPSADPTVVAGAPASCAAPVPTVAPRRDPQAQVVQVGGQPDYAAAVRESIPVVIADDEDLFRDLLSTVLSESGKVTVLGAYHDAEAAMDATRRLHPKVIVLDIELRGSVNGIQAGLLIRQEFPDVGIVWLSAYKRPYLPVSFQQQTTSGWAYLLKQSGTDVEALVAAIGAVANGFVVLDPQIAESMNRLLNTWIPMLSQPQYDVLSLMAQGFGNPAVARALGLPEKSVEGIINQIYHHLQLSPRTAKHRRVETVLRYLQGSGAPAAGASGRAAG